jgi:hypothetical protein
LQHIPVLNDFAIVIESKNIDARIVVIPRPFLMAMEYDIVAGTVSLGGES